MTKSVTPFLWFDTQAEDAMKFYMSVFKDSKEISVARPAPDAPAFTVEFELQGQRFMGLNAGPLYKFNESVSFFVSVETQDEIDYYWNALTASGGEGGNCGWLKDQFGLSWQIVPTKLGELLGGADHEGAGRAMQSMMGMKKLVITEMQQAYEGR